MMQSYKFPVFPALTAVLFILSQADGARALPKNSYSSLAARIRPSVVTVLVYEYSGRLKHIGSGFFYNENGDIVTNSHVLSQNCRAEIKTDTGKRYPVATIIERNEKTDFVKASTHIPQKTPWLSIAKNLPRVGDKIMVAGSPMGLEQTITEGIVSAWRKHATNTKMLQISAPVSPGSSGGPVMNMAGEVVGIAALQMVNGQNLNFAVPASAIFGIKKTSQKKLKFHKDDKGAIVISD